MKVIKPEKKPDVTAALREAIICGQLMPNERLIEVELATRFGSNRVQIRTALSKLESEGLVVSEPNRGARVRAVTADEALEITEARAAMETLVATKAAERATENDIARLRNIRRRSSRLFRPQWRVAHRDPSHRVPRNREPDPGTLELAGCPLSISGHPDPGPRSKIPCRARDDR